MRMYQGRSLGVGAGVSGESLEEVSFSSREASPFGALQALSETRFPLPSLWNQTECRHCVSTNTLGLALRRYGKILR